MKEKTFEELTEKFRVYDEVNFKRMSYRESVVELMQQVREATIAECRDIASEFSLSETLKHIDNLPTDRIKTDL